MATQFLSSFVPLKLQFYVTINAHLWELVSPCALSL